MEVKSSIILKYYNLLKILVMLNLNLVIEICYMDYT